MLSEAITKLQDLTTEGLRMVKLGEETTRTYYDYKGEVVTVLKEMPPRRHRVYSLDSLIDAICQFDHEKDETAVWVSSDRILVVLDDCGFRQNTITLPLQRHDAFPVLRSSDWLTQRSLIDMFRHSLADCSFVPPSILDVLRMLKFATNTEQTGEFDASTAKMGKSVHSQVTGHAALPELVAVSFHPYPGLARELPECAVDIACTLFTRPDEGTLKLEPQPGQLEEAERSAMQAVQTLVEARLQELAHVPSVFLGTP